MRKLKVYLIKEKTTHIQEKKTSGIINIDLGLFSIVKRCVLNIEVRYNVFSIYTVYYIQQL